LAKREPYLKHRRCAPHLSGKENCALNFIKAFEARSVWKRRTEKRLFLIRIGDAPHAQDELPGLFPSVSLKITGRILHSPTMSILVDKATCGGEAGETG
jgi:hypothetical protein